MISKIFSRHSALLCVAFFGVASIANLPGKINSIAFAQEDDMGGGDIGPNSGPGKKPGKNDQKPSAPAPSKKVPPGQELVSIDFPEPTEIKDIIKAVGQWTGKNFILSKNVSAKVSIISPQQVTKEEAYQAFLSALNVAGFTTVETGKVVKIVPTNVAPGANIKTFYGASWAPMTDEMITQIIPLTYIQANDITNQIRNTLRLSSNVSAFPSTNSIIVSDTGHKVRKLLEVIRLLDVKSNQPQFAIEPCKNTDANDIAKKIQDLFGAKGGGGSYLQKVIVDQRSNSLLLVGPPKGLDDVVRVIRRLDRNLEDASSQAQIHVRQLDYADADKLAGVLQSLAQGMAKAGPQVATGGSKKASGGSVADFGNVKISAEKTTNSLIIQGSRAAFDELDVIIKQLDRRRNQVYLEVDVVDVAVNNDLNIKLSALGGAATSSEYAQGHGAVLPFGWNYGAAGAFAVQDKAIPVTTRMQALPSSAIIGVFGSKSIDIGGIKLTPGAFLFALKSDGNSVVHHTPSQLVADNETAKFENIEREYYKNTVVDTTTKISTDKWDSYDANLSLDIKPQISKADYLNLDVKVKAEQFNRSNSADAPPGKSSRYSESKVTIGNAQTIVLSGLTRNIDSEGRDKVPLLGDIPILGWLFRNTTTSKKKTNLLIFITPNIIRAQKDLTDIYERKIKDRDEFLQAVYGKDFKETDMFKKLPGLDRAKIPLEKPEVVEPVVAPTPAANATGNAEEKKDEKKLPSDDSNPVVVPGATGGGSPIMGGGDPGFSSAPAGDMGGGDIPPPPPPPPPPGSNIEEGQ